MSSERELSDPSKRAPAEATRAALIAAGIRLFGQKGFEATSTRDLAGAAEVNIAAIAYHFGSKAGLRTACAQAAANRLASVVRPPASEAISRMGREDAQAVLEGAVSNIVAFMARGAEGDHIPAFVLREIAEEGAGLDIFYDCLIERVHKTLCQVFARATGGDPDSDDTRLTVFSMAGQAIYFRIARPIVTRRMGWSAYGQDEVRALQSVLVANLRAMIAARRETFQ